MLVTLHYKSYSHKNIDKKLNTYITNTWLREIRYKLSKSKLFSSIHDFDFDVNNDMLSLHLSFDKSFSRDKLENIIESSEKSIYNKFILEFDSNPDSYYSRKITTTFEYEYMTC